METRDEIINKILEDYAKGGSIKFYMQIAYKEAQKEIFEKFDEYACIKNDKWYLDYKKEKLEKE